MRIKRLVAGALTIVTLSSSGCREFQKFKYPEEAGQIERLKKAIDELNDAKGAKRRKLDELYQQFDETTLKFLAEAQKGKEDIGKLISLQAQSSQINKDINKILYPCDGCWIVSALKENRFADEIADEIVLRSIAHDTKLSEMEKLKDREYILRYYFSCSPGCELKKEADGGIEADPKEKAHRGLVR